MNPRKALPRSWCSIWRGSCLISSARACRSCWSSKTSIARLRLRIASMFWKPAGACIKAMRRRLRERPSCCFSTSACSKGASLLASNCLLPLRAGFAFLPCARFPCPRLFDGAICQPIDFIQLDRVVAAPFAQRREHRLEAQAERRGAVFDAGRDLAKDFSMNDAVLFHFPQLLDQHFLADIPQQAVHL